MLEGHPIKFKLGADINIMPFHYYNHLTLNPKIINCNTFLQSFGGLKIKPCGNIDSLIEISNKTDNSKLMIVNNVRAVPILGLQTCCVDLNLIKRVDIKVKNIMRHVNLQKLTSKYL